jgi:hypothetical protein
VKVVLANDYFSLVLRDTFEVISPFANSLDYSFYSFSPAIHGKNHVRIGQITDILIKKSQFVIAKGPRSKAQLLGLFYHGFHDFRMAMSLVDCGIGRKEIQVFLAFHIPDPYTFTTVLGTISIFQIDEVLGIHSYFSF